MRQASEQAGGRVHMSGDQVGESRPNGEVRTSRRLSRVLSAQGEDGQVLVLIIGFLLLIFLLFTLAVDASQALIARRSLNDALDGAALAAVSELDEGAYYATGEISLAQNAARQTALSYLERLGIPRLEARVEFPGPDRIQVTGRMRVRTTFLGLLGMSDPTVASQVTVRAARRSPL
jgi:Flp pilus assembly protein TadG